MSSAPGRRGRGTRVLLAAGLVVGCALVTWLAWSWMKAPAGDVQVRTGPVGAQVPENAAPPTMVPLTNSNDRQPREMAVIGAGAPAEVIGAPAPASTSAATSANTSAATTAPAKPSTPAATSTTAASAGAPAQGATTPPAPAGVITEGEGAAPVTASAPSVSSGAGVMELDAAIALADSNPVRARAALTRVLEGSALAPADRLRGYDAINRINGVLLFSNRVVGGDPYSMTYKVENGDSLARIAKDQKLDCDWRLVQRINGIKSANGLHAGQSIKLPKGTFHAEVRKGEYRINMFLGEGADRVMVASYPVGLGELNTTPTGAFVVRPKSKLIDPPWKNPRTGEAFAANDPKNPIGERWIGLKGIEPHNKGFEGYGIHGTIDPDSIGQQRSMGCVRMRAENVEVVYEMLTEPHSTIVIAP